jgi:hypothetical protein
MDEPDFLTESGVPTRPSRRSSVRSRSSNATPHRTLRKAGYLHDPPANSGVALSENSATMYLDQGSTSLPWRGNKFSVSSHFFSRRLTSLGPQLPHKTVNACRSLWSEGFDRIFRNEGVTGSNPVSSTKSPGQDDF